MRRLFKVWVYTSKSKTRILVNSFTTSVYSKREARKLVRKFLKSAREGYPYTMKHPKIAVVPILEG